MVSLGWLANGQEYYDNYFISPFSIGVQLGHFTGAIEQADLLIGFNLKFDLHWIRRYGVSFRHKRIWCCQLAHFLLTAQQHVYPSLNEVAEHYGLGQKFDIVEAEYWDKGIDTNHVPPDILLDYMKQDIALTYKIYLCQLEEFKRKPQLYKLFQISCLDLLALEEMEWNGLKLNTELCGKESIRINARIQEIESKLTNLFPSVPINWASGDHLSAILYGGKIDEVIKEPNGFFKSGARINEPRFKNRVISHEFDGFFKPLDGTQLKKEGFYSTDESVLRSLKGNKAGMDIISNLLEHSKLSKLLDYYQGWPNLIQEKDWVDGEIHGQFNQVVARTGRLSSSEPNLQNVAGICQDIIVSRYS